MGEINRVEFNECKALYQGGKTRGTRIEGGKPIIGTSM